MGLRDALKEQREFAKRMRGKAHYGIYYVSADGLEFREPGLPEKGARVNWVTIPVAGAVASMESSPKSRMTATRVAAGAILAGPAGAIVGGMLKKDQSTYYAALTFPDGRVIDLTANKDNERLLRDFVAAFNRAAFAASSIPPSGEAH